MTAAPEEGPRPRRRERLLLGLARLALIWEDLWPRAQPVLGVAGLFVGVALLDVLPALPTAVHVLVLGLFLAALLFALSKAGGGARAVTDARVRHRLEQDSGLADRPLATLDDGLAGGAGDPVAHALWRAHRARAERAVRALRLHPPSPGMAARDPRALRIAVALVVIVGAVAGAGDPGERLARALQPGGPDRSETATVDLWVTPPAYTGAPPIFLSGPSAAPITVPEGSRALVQVGGAGRAPVLRLDDETTPFQPIADSAEATGFRAEVPLRSGRMLTVEGARGRTLARWPLRLLADLPPEVAFAAPPQAISGARLRLPYQVRDDHGIAGMDAVIERAPGETLRLRIATPHRRPDDDGWQHGAAVHDLSANAWAGVAVTVWLEVRDGLDQTGRGDEVRMVLPERTFNHPVARDLAAARKRLNDDGAEARVEAHGLLSDILAAPDRFAGDTGIYLGVSTARAQLFRDGSGAGRRAVQDLLWEMALALEDGGLSLAARDVERLRQLLAEAIEDGAGDDVVAALVAQLQAAMERYLAELTERLREQGAENAVLSNDVTTLGSDEIRDMLERAREMARAGDMEGAKKLLAELAEMMEALRSGMENMPGRETMEKAKRLMDGIRTLTGRQSDLHRQTFDRVRQRDREDARLGRTAPKPDALQDQAGAQRGLTGELDRLMEQMAELLGQTPGGMAEARDAMRRAADALSEGRGDEGLAAQADALAKLRRAGDAAGKALSRSLSGIGGGGGMRPGGQAGRDPFGRGQGPGGAPGGDLKLPSRSERNRVRDIQNELRRRAGQSDRPAVEQDYIRRLLQRF